MGTTRTRWGICLLMTALFLPAVAADELIRNGDFEKGVKAFESGYRYSPGDIVDPGTYDVVKKPRSAHDSADDFGDHTSGKGFMLMVNGALKDKVVVWEQT